MRYLGGINAGYAILALLRLAPLVVSLSSNQNKESINTLDKKQFIAASDKIGRAHV